MAKGLSGVFAKLDFWQLMVNAGLTGLGNMYARQVENYAKEKAPWQPVRKPKKPSPFTGHARQSLFGTVYWDKNKMFVAISHSVSYGVYLELAHKRKYKILEEAVQSGKEGFFNAARTILTR